jgi:DNA-binding FadR family transcriptional regulator
LSASLSTLDGEAPKTGEALARRIEAEVIAAGWPVGAWLGSEPDLVARYGVSRSVLREAIRVLEHRMVARMRRGPGGGLIVTEPDASVVTGAAALYLDYQRVEASHLLQARSALELKCIELLTKRRLRETSARLQAQVATEATYTGAELIANSHEFHVLLAELTGDPALTLFINVLTQLTGEHSLPPELGAAHAGRNVYRTQRDHARIAEAIQAGDGSAASRLMLKHLEWVARGVADLEHSG